MEVYIIVKSALQVSTLHSITLACYLEAQQAAFFEVVI